MDLIITERIVKCFCSKIYMTLPVTPYKMRDLSDGQMKSERDSEIHGASKPRVDGMPANGIKSLVLLVLS